MNKLIPFAVLLASCITPVPPPGVHPRVIFNASDLPGIRQRLETTAAGRSAITGSRAWLAWPAAWTPTCSIPPTKDTLPWGLH